MSQSCLKNSNKWVNEVEWVSKVKVILWPWSKVTQISKLNVWLLACILSASWPSCLTQSFLNAATALAPACGALVISLLVFSWRKWPKFSPLNSHSLFMTFRHKAFIKIMKFLRDYIFEWKWGRIISVIPCLNLENSVNTQICSLLKIS